MDDETQQRNQQRSGNVNLGRDPPISAEFRVLLRFLNESCRLVVLCYALAVSERGLQFRALARFLGPAREIPSD